MLKIIAFLSSFLINLKTHRFFCIFQDTSGNLVTISAFPDTLLNNMPS